MSDKQSGDRIHADIGRVEGARPYGPAGNIPSGAVKSYYSPHATANSVPYYSDAPFVQPYNERPTCQGKRSDKKPCNAKAEPARNYCKAHDTEA